MSNALATLIRNKSVAIPFSGCWIWIGALDKSGYGQLTFNGKHMRAHRASYESYNNQTKRPLLVCHTCDVRECVNPEHLYSGNYKDNRRDMLERSDWKHPYGLRSSCSKGHQYTEGSFRIDSDGSRGCKICHRDWKRAYRLKQKGMK